MKLSTDKKLSEETKQVLRDLRESLKQDIKGPASMEYRRGQNDVILDLMNQFTEIIGDPVEADTPKTKPVKTSEK